MDHLPINSTNPSVRPRRAIFVVKVDHKTIERDVDLLRDLGVPIFYNARCHCWYIGEPVRTPEWFQILKRTFTH